MMDIPEPEEPDYVAEAIRASLQKQGFEGHRADDWKYHGQLYWNVMTYMSGCSFGIAVFQALKKDTGHHNPNVALEAGYMLAQGKPVCWLKDRRVKALPSDLAGKLYRKFSPKCPEKSISQVLPRWMRAKGLITPSPRKN